MQTKEPQIEVLNCKQQFQTPLVAKRTKVASPAGSPGLVKWLDAHKSPLLAVLGGTRSPLQGAIAAFSPGSPPSIEMKDGRLSSQIAQILNTTLPESRGESPLNLSAELQTSSPDCPSTPRLHGTSPVRRRSSGKLRTSLRWQVRELRREQQQMLDRLEVREAEAVRWLQTGMEEEGSRQQTLKHLEAAQLRSQIFEDQVSLMRDSLAYVSEENSRLCEDLELLHQLVENKNVSLRKMAFLVQEQKELVVYSSGLRKQAAASSNWQHKLVALSSSRLVWTAAECSLDGVNGPFVGLTVDGDRSKTGDFARAHSQNYF